MFTIEYTAPPVLADLDERIKAALALKLTELTKIMHDKVVANVSGAILQKQSGQLAESIRSVVETGGDVMVGSVFPDPASPKAWALEKGGRAFYPIVPTKASVLSWVNKGGDKVFARSVSHPPSKEFRYLGAAFDEMAELVPAGFSAAIQGVLDGAGA